jgi:hypothetical protein
MKLTEEESLAEAVAAVGRTTKVAEAIFASLGCVMAAPISSISAARVRRRGAARMVVNGQRRRPLPSGEIGSHPGSLAGHRRASALVIQQPSICL